MPVYIDISIIVIIIIIIITVLPFSEQYDLSFGPFPKVFFYILSGFVLNQMGCLFHLHLVYAKPDGMTFCFVPSGLVQTGWDGSLVVPIWGGVLFEGKYGRKVVFFFLLFLI